MWNEQWTRDPPPSLSFSPGTSDPSKCYFPLPHLHAKCLTSTFLLPPALISVFTVLLLIVLPHSNPSELVSPITEILSTNEKIKQVRRYVPLYMYCLQPRLSKHFYVLGHLSLLFPQKSSQDWTVLYEPLNSGPTSFNKDLASLSYTHTHTLKIETMQFLLQITYIWTCLSLLSCLRGWGISKCNLINSRGESFKQKSFRSFLV